MPRKTTPKTGLATKSGPVAVKIPRSSYRTLQRLAKREQRTLTAVVERAVEVYRSTTEGEST